jgi:hypothetical protein
MEALGDNSFYAEIKQQQELENSTQDQILDSSSEN